MSITSINPTSGQLIQEYSSMDIAACEGVLSVVDHAWQGWRKTPLSLRVEKLTQISKLLDARAEGLALLMAQEMGKPIKQGLAEIKKCIWVCQYYADNAKDFLKDVPIKTDAEESFISFQPLGVVLAIMPWNFPFWQVFRAAIPAITAGNAMLLKHASNVPGCSLAIEGLFKEAGFPENLFRVILTGNETISEIAQHPSIQGITITGSTQAGRQVGALAGKHLKKTVMELGGSDPYIVLEDADIEAAANACAISRMINGGQSCIAAKRMIVVASIRDAFEKAFIAKMASYAMGDPEDPKTELGPLARKDLRDALHEQVTQSVKQGARLSLGGKVPSGAGAFYPPTVLTDVRKGMVAYEEELFGPVATIISAKNEGEAITIANDSPFGLGAALFKRDLNRAKLIASQEINAGIVAINTLVQSDPRLPFGGTKASGFGRELGKHGMHEFVNTKSLVVHTP